MSLLPTLDSFDQSVYIAFSILSENRINSGFGISRIRISDILDYNTVYGSVFPIDIFVNSIINIDIEMTKYVNNIKEKITEKDKKEDERNSSRHQTKDTESFRFRQ